MPATGPIIDRLLISMPFDVSMMSRDINELFRITQWEYDKFNSENWFSRKSEEMWLFRPWDSNRDISIKMDDREILIKIIINWTVLWRYLIFYFFYLLRFHKTPIIDSKYTS